MAYSQKHQILGIREINADAYVLRLERGNLNFEPGQYVHISPLPGVDRREYTVYSSPREDYLELLIKAVPAGNLSHQLCRLRVRDEVRIEGPFGLFKLDSTALDSPLLFIATDSSISPFHCFIRYYPNLNYRLIHGGSTDSECYEYHEYDKNRLVSGFTREKDGIHHGGILDWLRNNPVPHDTMVYLCGSCAMIYDVYDILGDRGFNTDRIQVEVYY